QAIGLSLNDDRLPVVMVWIFYDQAAVARICLQLVADATFDRGQILKWFEACCACRANRMLQGIQVVSMSILRILDDEARFGCVAVDPGGPGVWSVDIESKIAGKTRAVRLDVSPF